ncbi:MAG: hypothetical protein IIY04_02650 [Oscillospiraceae bacterium]|nr:hypothetical protein [Oscillospiraceae bacterium]
MMKKIVCLMLAVLMCMTVLTACGHEHTWTPADCTTAQTCAECGEVEGEALGHIWQLANCTEPETCVQCGLTEGEALGHDLLPATYQQGEVCTVCGEEVSEPLAADFETYGIAAEALQVGQSYTYNTVTGEGNPTQGTLRVANYEVIDSDELRPAREGYQWHVVTFETVFADPAVMQTGVVVDFTVTDYYDIAGFKDNADHSDESISSYTVNYNGEDVPVYCGQSGGYTPNDDGTLTFEFAISVQIPVGYDGIVVGMNNSTVDTRVNNYLYDVYSADDFVLFRIAG